MARGNGKLVIIGGAEDKDGPCEILQTFITLAGGTDARLVVLTVAAGDPEDVGSMYRELFYQLGAGRVTVLHLPDRQTANQKSAATQLGEATGIFFTGGDQLRITSILGGTKIDQVLHRRYDEGAVIAGTSAGAAAMSAIMIVEGASDDAPKKCTTKLSPGMGFWEKVVIDQHFAQRGRTGRLLAAIAQNPHILGVGIDEDTAVVQNGKDRFEVIGTQTVTVLDGRGIQHTNTSISEPDEPLALTYVNMHILPAGYGFDLDKRQPLLPV